MPEHTPAPTPSRSLYGFFLYLFSKIILFVYCTWAFIPNECLHYFNIYYYPQKYWSTTVPMQCLLALTLFAFLIYPSFNLTLTVNVDNINTICDSFTHYSNKINDNHHIVSEKCICSNKSKCMKNVYLSTPKDNEKSVPHLYDLNIRYVCKKLYLNKLTE